MHKAISLSLSQWAVVEMEVTVGIWFALVVSWIVLLGLWRVSNWLWLRPKKLERLLRKQGLKGNPYRLLHGDIKDMVTMTRGARSSKPLHPQSNSFLPRVFPLQHLIITKYGKKCFMWDGVIPNIIVVDPELIEEILLNKNNNFKKPTPSATLRLLLPGLVGFEDEKWAKHRRIMNPVFYLEKLKHMLPAMHVCCSDMLRNWEELVLEKGGSCELDVSPYLQNLTADIISRTAFGSSYEQGTRIFQLQTEQAVLIFRLSHLLNFPGRRFLPTKINKRIKEIDSEVKALVRGIINERKKAMKLGEVGNDDLLSTLLRANLREIQERGNNKKAGMSNDEVINECKQIYFVGQETSAQLLVWATVLLSAHPNWQDRAREEVRQIFGNNKPDYNGINQLKIVTMILNEVLRLYPPAIMMHRVCYKDTKLGEMVVPAGTRLMICKPLVHHDSEVWGEDSEEFKPERFSEGVAKATKKQAASFIPFGLGPRNCIGNNFATLEAKMVLVTILQRFSFELSPSYTHAPCFRVTLQPENGAHIILHKI